MGIKDIASEYSTILKSCMAKLHQADGKITVLRIAQSAKLKVDYVRQIFSYETPKLPASKEDHQKIIDSLVHYADELGLENLYNPLCRADDLYRYEIHPAILAAKNAPQKPAPQTQPEPEEVQPEPELITEEPQEPKPEEEKPVAVIFSELVSSRKIVPHTTEKLSDHVIRLLDTYHPHGKKLPITWLADRVETHYGVGFKGLRCLDGHLVESKSYIVKAACDAGTIPEEEQKALWEHFNLCVTSLKEKSSDLRAL